MEYREGKIKEVQHYLIDMDGTVYLSNQLFDGAIDFIETLKEQKKPFLFMTNNSSSNKSLYSEKLGKLGISVTEDQVFTSGEATTIYLKEQGIKRVNLLGTPPLEDEFIKAGFELCDEQVDCVVLGFDMTLTYEKLTKACLLIREGVPFIATHPDLVCPTANGYIPDCGAMIALIEKATGVSPKIIGKPYSEMVNSALKKLDAKAEETAIIGDRLYTDIKMGIDSGLTSVLVMSGETTEKDLAESDLNPDCIFPSVKEIAEHLRQD